MKKKWDSFRSRFLFVTPGDLAKLGKIIMSQITDFENRVNVAFSGLNEQTTAAVESIAGLAEDLDFLKAEIARIQNSPGTLSPEDQAALDRIEGRLSDVSANVNGVVGTLRTLDSATTRPPTLPPQPPEQPA